MSPRSRLPPIFSLIGPFFRRTPSSTLPFCARRSSERAPLRRESPPDDERHRPASAACRSPAGVFPVQNRCPWRYLPPPADWYSSPGRYSRLRHPGRGASGRLPVRPVRSVWSVIDYERCVLRFRRGPVVARPVPGQRSRSRYWIRC